MREELEWLADFVTGKVWPYGKGIVTYPNGDKEHKKLHEAMEELEKAGLVEKEVVTWKPKE